jgi:chromate transport protein ChrA
MPPDAKNQLHQLMRYEKLCRLRNWFLCLGALALALALMAVMNTAGNPKTWASGYNALASSGAFSYQAVWLAGIGCLLILLGVLFAFWSARKKRELF